MKRNELRPFRHEVAVDRNRRPAALLLTGPANLMFSPTVSESRTISWTPYNSIRSRSFLTYRMMP